MLTVIFASGILLAVALRLYLTHKRKNKLPLPPGPPADPLIGHARIIPVRNGEEIFHEWAKVYGDVMHLHAFGKSIIVLSSEEAARELLDKRSANYSNRPEFPLFSAIGWESITVFLPYGELFQKHRRVIQPPFSRKNVEEYRPIQDEEVTVLLHNILQRPEKFDKYLHRMSTAIILTITYGFQILSDDDPCLLLAERFIDFLRDCSEPSLLNISSKLISLPGWFPGAWHVDFIKNSRPLVHKMINYPMELLKQRIASGTAKPCIAATQLELLTQEGTHSAKEVEIINLAMHQIFGGGSETNWHTLTCFFLCMMLNPEAQAKGQREIDEIVGTKRLPDFSDRDSLPYVECIMKETMRWHPVTPLSVPHRSVADDYYNGMFIPAGSTILANTRSMTLDEDKYSDPQAFIPERFLPRPLGRGETLSDNVIFGWGRRMCPGQHLADGTIWLAIVRLLATFTISKATDAAGQLVEPQIKFVTAFTSHPEPFPCAIRPRSEQSAKLVTDAYNLTSHAAQSSKRE